MLKPARSPRALGFALLALVYACVSACSDDDPHVPGADLDAGTHDAAADIDSGAALHATKVPLVLPHVRAATPEVLDGPAGSVSKAIGLSTDDIRNRFFIPGPSSLYRILTELDARITEINMRSGDTVPVCRMQAPVSYEVHPSGRSVPFYAQCYVRIPSTSAEPSFLQFGEKDGVFYLYIADGVEHVAARLTRVMAGDSDASTSASSSDGGADAFKVDAWIGLGYSNGSATGCGAMHGFDGCSYGVIELHTDESRRAFELSVAGIGFGFCGAQLKSDGLSLYAIGSIDMGSSCTEPRTLCVAASDMSTSANCTSALTTFSTQSLGRKATSGFTGSIGASGYPGATNNQVVLDGTSSDSLRFGPSDVTSGVGAY